MNDRSLDAQTARIRPSPMTGTPMNSDELVRGILDQVASGAISTADATESLKTQLGAARNLGFARVDVGRESRTGFPEVIYGDGKEPEQIAAIAAEIFAHSGMVLVTRTTREALEEVRKNIPSAQFNPSARVIWADERPPGPKNKGVTVACAGTSDLPVAEEAAITATLMGCDVERINDIGIAGLHRLLNRLEDLRRARVLVVVAGMEGALPSVVAGLVRAPVIAVPTSVGYGANLGGVTALLAMLNSCSPGVTVVNIDNGFAAGYTAALIAGATASNANSGS